MRKLFLSICLMTLFCGVSAVATACKKDGESTGEPTVTQTAFTYDITNYTEALFIDSNEVEKVTLNGETIAKDDYIVKNGYLLLQDGLYQILGCGTHTVEVAYAQYPDKTVCFSLTVEDKKPLVYEVPEINGEFYAVDNFALPCALFGYEAQEKEVSYSITKDGVTVTYEVVDNTLIIQNVQEGSYQYNIEIKRGGETVKSVSYKVYAVDPLLFNILKVGALAGEKNAESEIVKNGETGEYYLQLSNIASAGYPLYRFDNEFINERIANGETEVFVQFVVKQIGSTGASGFNFEWYDSSENASKIVGFNKTFSSADIGEIFTTTFSLEDLVLDDGDDIRIRGIHPGCSFAITKLNFSKPTAIDSSGNLAQSILSRDIFTGSSENTVINMSILDEIVCTRLQTKNNYGEAYIFNKEVIEKYVSKGYSKLFIEYILYKSVNSEFAVQLYDMEQNEVVETLYSSVSYYPTDYQNRTWNTAEIDLSDIVLSDTLCLRIARIAPNTDFYIRLLSFSSPNADIPDTPSEPDEPEEPTEPDEPEDPKDPTEPQAPTFDVTATGTGNLVGSQAGVELFFMTGNGMSVYTSKLDDIPTMQVVGSSLDAYTILSNNYLQAFIAAGFTYMTMEYVMYEIPSTTNGNGTTQFIIATVDPSAPTTVKTKLHNPIWYTKGITSSNYQWETVVLDLSTLNLSATNYLSIQGVDLAKFAIKTLSFDKPSAITTTGNLALNPLEGLLTPTDSSCSIGYSDLNNYYAPRIQTTAWGNRTVNFNSEMLKKYSALGLTQLNFKYALWRDVSSELHIQLYNTQTGEETTLYSKTLNLPGDKGVWQNVTIDLTGIDWDTYVIRFAKMNVTTHHYFGAISFDMPTATESDPAPAARQEIDIIKEETID